MSAAAPEPFVGEVRGVRRFRVRNSETLTPIFGRPAPFRPGTNVADCRAVMGPMLHHRGGRPPPAEECRCGFYAYYRDDLDHYQFTSNTMQGVVEAWGKVITGNNGFRAENMRLVALVRRPAYPPRIREFNGIMLPGDGITVPAASAGAVGFYLSLALQMQILLPDTLAVVFIAVMTVLFGMLGHRTSGRALSKGEARTRRADEALADHYGVPLFETLAQAQDAFPITGRPDKQS